MGMLHDCTPENPYITLRATHSMYLNDTSEYKFGWEICKKALIDVEDELEIKEESRLSNKYFCKERLKDKETMDYVYSTIPHTIDWGMPYLISLSKNRDCLPMWNTYANGGQGIALGFNKSKLRLCRGFEIKDCCYAGITGTVIYGDSEFNKRYERIKEFWRLQYDNRMEIEDSNLSELISNTIPLALRDYILYIKHNAYSYEREVRCVVTRDRENKLNDSIKYRSNNKLIIPYVERKIDIKLLEQIVIGPCADKERMKASMLMFLKDKIKDYDRIDIEDSDIPFRG